MMAASAIVMPKLGLTMTEGLLASWRVAPGDRVRNGDVLFVVETEKIATEIEAQGDGRIETIEVAAGATVPVGAVVATWSGGGAAAAVPEATPEAAPVASQPRSSGGERIVATPLARRLARDAGVPLATLVGGGPRGRIRARDVEAAIAARAAAPATSDAPAAGDRRAATGMEKTVARRMAQAKQTIPHFYVLAEADVTELLKLRDDLNAMEGLTRISINHLVMAAVGRAIVRMPEINVVWDEDAVVQLAGSDVGMAVDSGRGLFAPVVRDAGGRSLDALARDVDALVARARTGQLSGDDLAGGAIAVSNVGMHGASHLVPIINPGQSAILGVAAIKPVFRPDANAQPTLCREIGLVLACDHRVHNGVAAARFLDCVTGILQHPLSLLRG
ncbi:MAG: 2-oxo acid dehydrogenase subunit E2 [Xanthobacteraceae bacterium]|nr:2-oxo acid dehydrogenase subunit E2 [Xanthobacteraceae bacterium]